MLREETPSLRSLFDELIDLAPERHDAFFAERGVDGDLKLRLQRMWASRTEPGSGLPDEAPLELAELLGDEEAPTLMAPGARIGSFELLDVIGEGGSATVFRAARTVDGVRQVVALKLLHRGMQTADAQRLFRRERLALSQLEHPGIARFIEGGVAENGVAYIALDFIDGRPITDDVRVRHLDARSRLALIVDVCRAVEAAHRALIVHRDLKPTNVLVDGHGQIKLLDFGIAKLLDDPDDLKTRLPAFTPAYAAPEQKSGGPITTATDVFALGVLVGEILTGQRVRDASERARAGSTDRSKHGAAASAFLRLPRKLQGDLDKILGKATAAEPARRYASAGALADDIERLLRDEPVLAHPPSRWYRAGKFVKRHRAIVASSAIFVLGVVAALGVALWQARLARLEADRANAVRDFLVSVFRSADASVPKDARPSVEDVVVSAADRLKRERAVPDAVRADLMLTLAEVATSVSSYDEARTLLDEGEPLLDATAPADDPRRWDAVITRAMVLVGRSPSSEPIKLLEPLRAQMLARGDARSIEGLLLLGNALMNDGHEADGLGLIQSARGIADANPAMPLDVRLTATLFEAEALNKLMRFGEGIERAEAALEIWHRTDDAPNNEVADVYSAIALASEALGNIARADDAYRQAIAVTDRFFDKPNEQNAWIVGIYATFLIAQGRLTEAEPYAMRALDLRRQVAGEDDDRTLYALAGLGKLRIAARRSHEAYEWFTKGVESCRRTQNAHQVCARLFALRASSEAQLHDFTAAHADLVEAENRQREFGGETGSGYAYVLAIRSIVEVEERRFEDALATIDRALEMNRSAKGGMLQAELELRFRRALCLHELGRDNEVLPEILAIEPAYGERFPQAPGRVDIAALKARALARAGRIDEARPAAAQAQDLDRAWNRLTPDVVRELRLIAGRKSG